MQIDSIFNDLIVVELASVLAGPSVGMFFAELGAKVIKIENKRLGGDVTRTWRHSLEISDKAKSAYYHSVNFKKEEILLDLSDQSDNKTALELIDSADIVISNFRSRSAKKLGMNYDNLKSRNPRLIFANISAYGANDDRPGFDALIQAETGWMHMNGHKNTSPTKMPVALMDVIAGHQLKEGVLIALIRRMKTGKGGQIDVSLFDSGISALTNQATNWLNLGVIPNRKGNQHPNIAPYGDLVVTADDQYLILAIGNDRQFNSLCIILDIPEIAKDIRFSKNIERVKNRTDLMSYLLEAARKYSAKSIIDSCKNLNVPIGPIQDLKQVFNDPKAKELILEQTESDGSISKRVKTAIFKLS